MKKQNLWERVRLIFFMLVIILPGLEIGLWILGYRPYRQIPFTIFSTPEYCLIPHQRYGFSLMPGKYEVTVNGGKNYRATHGVDSLRITSYSNLNDSLPTVYLMGCSYTYGMGVDDSLTFPFIIQGKLPGFRVRNFGVPGYGTVQSLLQLQAAITSEKKPSLIVINYADFHNMRNVLSTQYRRNLFMGYERANPQIRPLMQKSRVPYVVLLDGNSQIQWEAWPDIYHHWKWRESLATVNAFQNVHDLLADRQIQAAKASVEVFMEIDQLCRENHIPLLVAGLTQTAATFRMLRELHTRNIRTIDISVDMNNSRFNQLPYDSHPSQFAHQHFADQLLKNISELSLLLPAK